VPALPHPTRILSAEEYLQRERQADTRSEYLNGQLVSMAGGTIAHETICVNVLSALHSQMKGRPCRAFGSNLKVRIEKANAFRYPDVSALCGTIQHHDRERDAYTNPSLIAEVLSPSTAAYDRGEKFALYRLIESLNEYLLIDQERMEVELWARHFGGEWSATTYNEAADRFAIGSLNVSLTLAEIYAGVDSAQ
jgi:Uma2 family endonuclease